MKNKPYPYYDTPELNSFDELLDYCAKEFKNNKAFFWKEKKTEASVTYLEVKQDVDALSLYLFEKGITDKHIAILGENSYNWIRSYFAIVKAGNVTVPLDRELSSKELQTVTEKGDCTYLLYSEDYREIAEEISGVEKISMKEIDGFVKEGKALISNGKTQNLKTDETALCSIIFTSGTTGVPKGVMLSQKNYMRDCVITCQNLDAPANTVLLLPLNHAYGFLGGVLFEMIKGGHIFINKSLRTLLKDVQETKPKHLLAVPLVAESFYKGVWAKAREGGKEKSLKMLVKISNALLKVGIDLRRKLFKTVIDSFGGELEMIICGGAPLDEKVVKGMSEMGIRIINGYGISECSPVVSTVRNKHFSLSSVGIPQPGVEVKIVDGEVWVKGDIVSSGYYKEPELTAEVFVDGWFNTGDIGCLDEDGLLYITGRTKNLIILSNGKNVSAEELEKVIYQLDYVAEVVVFAKDDKICAEAFLDSASGKTEEDLKKDILEINRSLASYKNIGTVLVRDSEFPKTSTKKIKRNTETNKDA